MVEALSRMLTLAAIGVTASVLSVSACTHTTDRVVEPVGAHDASTPEPELSDGGLNPLTPIALPPEPPIEDYRLVRAPELGLARETSGSLLMRASASADMDQTGGSGGNHSAGTGGSDLRPVATGGNRYY